MVTGYLKSGYHQVLQSLGLVTVLLWGGGVVQASPPSPQPVVSVTANLPYTVYKLGRHSLYLQEPKTPEHFEAGLMGRSQLEANHGMLFRFEPAQPTRFWMKDCLLPLDFVYGLGQTVVATTPNVAPCVQTPCSILNSPGAVNWVLELPAGSIKRLNLHSGLTLHPL
jgi:uncharacterized protein